MLLNTLNILKLWLDYHMQWLLLYDWYQSQNIEEDAAPFSFWKVDYKYSNFVLDTHYN